MTCGLSFGRSVIRYDKSWRRERFNDHAPPHFHARYGSDQVIIDIQTLQVLGGRLGPRVMGLVVEWALRIAMSYWRTGGWRAIAHR
jgi:hypothetical protein